MPQQPNDWVTVKKPTESEPNDWVDVKPPSGGFASGYGLPSLRDIATTAAKIPTQLGETLVGLGDIVTAPVRKGLDAAGLPNRAFSTALKEEFGYDPKLTKNFIESFESPELVAAKKRMAEAEGVSGTLSSVYQDPGLAALTIEESLPYLAGGAGVARGALRAAPALGRIGASMIGEGAIGAGSQAAQIREEKGDFTPSDALIATGSGAATAVTSGVSGKIAKGLGLPDIDAMLADKTVKGVRRIPALFGGGIAEAGEEALQSGQEQAAINLATGKPIGQGVTKAGTTGGIVGGITGGTVPMFMGSGTQSPPPPPIEPEADLPLNVPPSGETPNIDLNRPAPYTTPPPTVNLDPQLTQRLYDLGYSQGDINRMSHGQALDTIRKRIRYTGGPDSAFSQAMRSRESISEDAPPVDVMGNEIDVPTPRLPNAFERAARTSKIPGEDAPLIDVEGNELPPQTFEESVDQAPTPDVIPPQPPDVGPPSGMEVKVLDQPLSSYSMVDLKAEGWQFAGMENGKIRMVRKAPDLSINQPETNAAEGVQGVSVNPDGDMKWPTTPSPDVVANVEKQGFKFDSASNIFRKLKGAFGDAVNRSGEDVGEFTPVEMWENLKRILGRDPTPAEVEQGMNRQVRPGETTGRVAQFSRPQLPARPSSPLEEFANRNPGYLNPSYTPIKGTDLQVEGGLPPDPSTDLGNNLPYEASKAEVDAMMAYKEPIDDPDMPGPLDPMWTDSPAYGLDPRMAKRIEDVGSTDWDFTPRTNQQDPSVPFDLRQRNMLERIDQAQTDPDAEIRQFQNNEDSEIKDYLESEDARPPEMTDLDDYEPSEMARPRVDTENNRIQQLKQQIDEAYRNKDINRVVELSQELEAIETASRPRGAQELYDRGLRGKEGNWWEPRISDENDPSRMEVPGTRRGGGLNNIAVGGADEPVLDMLATALYTRDRPATVINELFQNAADERKISGRQEPIRVAFRYSAENPKTGAPAVSIIVKDFGRGMMPQDLYTIFTDVGKSGKRDVVDASGGFGFAKAAPLLGGDYVIVTSTTIDPETGDMVRYTFEGDPADLKNQKKGVPLKDELVEDSNAQTGFQVEVFFPENKSLYEADKLLHNVVEGTPNMKGVQLLSDYSSYDTDVKEFLETGKTAHSNEVKELEGVRVPPRQHTINSDTSDIDVHFELDDKTRDRGKLIILNNGLFVYSKNIGYGRHSKPHLPAVIVADIKATVKEGTDGYPFGLNRQDVRQKTLDDITNWVNDGLVKRAEAIRLGELQKVFDDLKPAPGNGHVIHDSGARYTPQERMNLEYDPHLGLVAEEMRVMLQELNDLFPTEQLGRTVKYGWIVGDPSSGGLNIPSPKAPADAKEYAILVNPLGLITKAANPMVAAEKIAHAILHEFNHNMVRAEGGGFTWQLLETDAAYGTARRADVAAAIYSAITGPDGNYAPRIQRLLQEYTAARGRPDVILDSLSRQRESEWIRSEGQDGVSSSDRDAGGGVTPDERSIIDRAKQLLRDFTTDETGAIPVEDHLGMFGRLREASGWGQGGRAKSTASELEGIAKDEAPTSFAKEAWQFGTGATTTMDYSAPGRQGMSQIFTRDFWRATARMYQGGWTPESFDKIDAEIRALPIHKQEWDVKTGNPIPTVAQRMGIKMMEPGHRAGPREQGTAGRWLETGNFLGGKNIPFTDKRNPLAAVWAHTIGRPIRGSNRAFTTFLNHLRSNRAQYLMDRAREMSQEALTTGYARPGIFKQKIQGMDAMALDPYFNDVLAREIGDFVNTATGRGPLKIKGPWKGAEVSFESSASKLSAVLFSPRNLFAKIHMLNPSTYVMATPFVRKQYMKAALSSGLAWTALTQLAKLASDDDDITVSNDITNSDFGKIRIGDTRMDPGSGFQQFLVLLARGMAGGYTSSVSEEFHAFGEGYNPETGRSTLQRFVENKLNPSTKFIYDLIDASEYKPFNLMDRTLQMAVPLMMQDLIGIVKEDPELLPWMIPIIHGWGTQTYDKDENPGRLIPSEYDRVIEGGGPLQWMGLREPGSFDFE